MSSQKSREVISIQSGQAGVQLGHAMWELLTIEHNISSGGILNDVSNDDTSFQTFFSLTSENQCVPRSLIFDSEPTVIDEIRCGYYRKLFHPDCLLNGYEDAANNYARGYYSESKRMMRVLVDRTRSMIEHCDHFQGFLVQSSIAGGTGSGLLISLMEYLVIEFAGRTSIQLSIFPGTSLSNCIVQPYNCLLSQEKLVYCSDLNLIVDNEGLYSICQNQLDMKSPSFSDINRIISPILSGLTAPIRFKGMLNSDLYDLSTNLIPFPRLHFPFVSYAPLMSKEKSDHDFIDTASLTRAMFLKENQLINADLQNGYFMSSALLYRGNCDLSNILKSIQDIKMDKNLHWVDWCPTAFKISHTRQMPVSVPNHGPMEYDKSAMMLTNHNAILPTFKSLENAFNALFKRRAYLHWYVMEGMEESEIHQALYEVKTITDDYFNIIDHISMDTEYVTSADFVDTPMNMKGTNNSIRSKSIDAIELTSTKIIPVDEVQRSGKKNESDAIVTIIDKKNRYETDNSKLSLSKTGSLSNLDVTVGKLESLGKMNENNFTPDISYRKAREMNGSNETVNVPYSYRNILYSRNYSNNVDGSSDTVSKSSKVSNEIFDICERNYIQNHFKTFNKKQILRQNVPSEESGADHFIKKLYLKNKGMLQRILHVQQYDMTKSPLLH